MGQIAAERATIANLRMRHVGGGFLHEWLMHGNLGVMNERAVTRQRPDAQRAVVTRPNVIQGHQWVEIEQQGRLRQTEIHRRDQALSPRKKHGIVAVLSFDGKHLFQ